MALRVVPKLMSGELDDPDALTPKVLSDLRTLTSESVVRGLAVLFGVEPAILYQLPQLPPEPCHCSKCGRMIEDEKGMSSYSGRSSELPGVECFVGCLCTCLSAVGMGSFCAIRSRAYPSKRAIYPYSKRVEF